MTPQGAQIVASMHLRFDEGNSHKEYHGIVARHGGLVLGLCAFGRVGSRPRHTIYFEGRADSDGAWLAALDTVMLKVAEKRGRGYRILSFENWERQGLLRARDERAAQATPDLFTAPAPGDAAHTGPAHAAPDIRGSLPATWWADVREGVSWPAVVQLARHPATAILVREDRGGQVVVGGEHAVLVDRNDLDACDCTCGAEEPCDHLRASAMLLSGALVA